MKVRGFFSESTHGEMPHPRIRFCFGRYGIAHGLKRNSLSTLISLSVLLKGIAFGVIANR